MPKITPEELHAVMEFGHVIRVHADGTVSDSPRRAPEMDAVADTVSDGWELLRGYTGQHGYNGPIMHASEFIGGSMARAILSTPGDYVALVAEYWTDADGNPLDEPDADGWAVAFKAAQ